MNELAHHHRFDRSPDAPERDEDPTYPAISPGKRTRVESRYGEPGTGPDGSGHDGQWAEPKPGAEPEDADKADKADKAKGKGKGKGRRGGRNKRGGRAKAAADDRFTDMLGLALPGLGDDDDQPAVPDRKPISVHKFAAGPGAGGSARAPKAPKVTKLAAPPAPTNAKAALIAAATKNVDQQKRDAMASLDQLMETMAATTTDVLMTEADAEQPSAAPLDMSMVISAVTYARDTAHANMRAAYTSARLALLNKGPTAQNTLIHLMAGLNASHTRAMSLDARVSDLRSKGPGRFRKKLAQKGARFNKLPAQMIAEAKTMAKRMDKSSPFPTPLWELYGDDVKVAIDSAAEFLDTEWSTKAKAARTAYGKALKESLAPFDFSAARRDLARVIAMVPAQQARANALLASQLADLDSAWLLAQDKLALANTKSQQRKSTSEADNASKTVAAASKKTKATETAAQKQIDDVRGQLDAMAANLSVEDAGKLRRAIATTQAGLIAWKAESKTKLAGHKRAADADASAAVSGVDDPKLIEPIQAVEDAFITKVNKLPGDTDTRLDELAAGLAKLNKAFPILLRSQAQALAASGKRMAKRVSGAIGAVNSMFGKARSLFSHMSIKTLQGEVITPHMTYFEGQTLWDAAQQEKRPDFADLERRVSQVHRSIVVSGTKEIPLLEGLRGLKGADQAEALKKLYAATGGNLESRIYEELGNEKELLEALAHLSGDRVLGALFALHNAAGDDDEARIEKILRGLSPKELEALRSGKTLDGKSLDKKAFAFMAKVNKRADDNDITKLMNLAGLGLPGVGGLTSTILAEAKDEMEDDETDNKVYEALLNNENGMGHAMASAHRIQDIADDEHGDSDDIYMKSKHYFAGATTERKDADVDPGQYGSHKQLKRALAKVRNEDGMSGLASLNTGTSGAYNDYFRASLNAGHNSNAAMAARLELGTMDHSGALVTMGRDDADHRTDQHAGIYMDLAKRIAAENGGKLDHAKFEAAKKDIEAKFGKRHGDKYWNPTGGSALDAMLLKHHKGANHDFISSLKDSGAGDWTDKGELGNELAGKGYFAAWHECGTNDELTQRLGRNRSKHDMNMVKLSYAETANKYGESNTDMHAVAKEELSGKEEWTTQLSLMGKPESAKDYLRMKAMLEDRFGNEVENQQLHGSFGNVTQYIDEKTGLFHDQADKKDGSDVKTLADAGATAMVANADGQAAIDDQQAEIARTVAEVGISIATGGAAAVVKGIAKKVATVVAGAAIKAGAGNAIQYGYAGDTGTAPTGAGVLGDFGSNVGADLVGLGVGELLPWLAKATKLNNLATKSPLLAGNGLVVRSGKAAVEGAASEGYGALTQGREFSLESWLLESMGNLGGEYLSDLVPKGDKGGGDAGDVGAPDGPAPDRSRIANRGAHDVPLRLPPPVKPPSNQPRKHYHRAKPLQPTYSKGEIAIPSKGEIAIPSKGEVAGPSKGEPTGTDGQKPRFGGDPDYSNPDMGPGKDLGLAVPERAPRVIREAPPIDPDMGLKRQGSAALNQMDATVRTDALQEIQTELGAGTFDATAQAELAEAARLAEHYRHADVIPPLVQARLDFLANKHRGLVIADNPIAAKAWELARRRVLTKPPPSLEADVAIFNDGMARAKDIDRRFAEAAAIEDPSLRAEALDEVNDLAAGLDHDDRFRQSAKKVYAYTRSNFRDVTDGMFESMGMENPFRGMEADHRMGKEYFPEHAINPHNLSLMPRDKHQAMHVLKAGGSSNTWAMNHGPGAGAIADDVNRGMYSEPDATSWQRFESRETVEGLGGETVEGLDGEVVEGLDGDAGPSEEAQAPEYEYVD